MSKYEFVTKKEYSPIRLELEEIIKNVQNILRKDFTFQFKLVGSGNRHLITREINGNKGFDFDYNLILNKYYSNPKYVKEKIIKAINQAIKGTKYDFAENSTTSITIKVKDTKNKKIEHSCDFAIVYYSETSEEKSFKYIQYDKIKNQYIWTIRQNSNNIDDKLVWLRKHVNNYWSLIRENYLNLKNTNKDEHKHSFQLYYETINNLYNKYSNRKPKFINTTR